MSYVVEAARMTVVVATVILKQFHYRQLGLFFFKKNKKICLHNVCTLIDLIHHKQVRPVN